MRFKFAGEFICQTACRSCHVSGGWGHYLLSNSGCFDVWVCSRFSENQIAFIYASVKNPHPSACNIQLNYTQEDFKMKKLLLNLLVVMSTDLAAVQVRPAYQQRSKQRQRNTWTCLTIQIYGEERVILALLTLMKPPGALAEWQTMARDWSASQQEALQLQALTALATITPLMLESYMSCQGNTCLLLLLDWCVRQGKVATRPKAVWHWSCGVRGQLLALTSRFLCLLLYKYILNMGSIWLNLILYVHTLKGGLCQHECDMKW